MELFGYLTRRQRLLRRRRAAAGLQRYAWEDALGDYVGVSDARYMSISEIDRWRAVPFDMPPSPERGAVMQRVRQLVEGLNGALDEGTASALDRYIEAWVGRWIATVETEYADHCGVIDLFRCQAAEWMRETTVKLEHARAELDQIRGDYLIVAARLRREVIAQSESESKAETQTEAEPEPEAESDREPVTADPEAKNEIKTDEDSNGHESGD
jgi:hypothetical protein